MDVHVPDVVNLYMYVHAGAVTFDPRCLRVVPQSEVPAPTAEHAEAQCVSLFNQKVPLIIKLLMTPNSE